MGPCLGPNEALFPGDRNYYSLTDRKNPPTVKGITCAVLGHFLALWMIR